MQRKHKHAHFKAYRESAAQAKGLDMTKTQLKDRKALFPHQGRLLWNGMETMIPIANNKQADRQTEGVS